MDEIQDWEEPEGCPGRHDRVQRLEVETGATCPCGRSRRSQLHKPPFTASVRRKLSGLEHVTESGLSLSCLTSG